MDIESGAASARETFQRAPARAVQDAFIYISFSSLVVFLYLPVLSYCQILEEVQGTSRPAATAKVFLRPAARAAAFSNVPNARQFSCRVEFVFRLKHGAVFSFTLFYSLCSNAARRRLEAGCCVQCVHMRRAAPIMRQSAPLTITHRLDSCPTERDSRSMR